MSEVIVEKLFEQRNMYLNTLKHLNFQLVEEISEKEVENNKKLQKTTIEQLKKIEQELAFILSKK
jgi:UDP-N-acetylglucosamine enolpyruvyl transferase